MTILRPLVLLNGDTGLSVETNLLKVFVLFGMAGLNWGRWPAREM